MLQFFYDELGFFGSILMALFLFLLFVFWFSGLAGLAGQPASNVSRNTKLTIAVIFPPFAIGWLIYDMHRQHKIIKGNTKRI
jgi:hypothetical protein